MTLWARLTWQARDHGAFAAELARRLEVPVRPGGLVPGARLIDLGTCVLEVRPWIREGPDDAPRTAGRLLLEPVPNGEEPPATEDAAYPLELVGLGWVTVDLARAEDELDPWLGPRPAAAARTTATTTPASATPASPTPALDADDEHLGARTGLREGAGLPGAWTVLLEPSTEGRAAASAARDGEGPCALYLRPRAGLEPWVARARDREVSFGAPREGPFGAQVLLAAGPSGPHVIVTEGRTPVSAALAPGTIAP